MFWPKNVLVRRVTLTGEEAKEMFTGMGDHNWDYNSKIQKYIGGYSGLIFLGGTAGLNFTIEAAKRVSFPFWLFKERIRLYNNRV